MGEGRGEGEKALIRLGCALTSPMHIQIRKATALDTRFIVDSNVRLAQETENLQLDFDRVNSGVRALLDDPAKGTYYIAEVDGTTAGQLLIAYEWSDWRNGMFWWIQSVYVVRERRGAGVFRALYNHIESLARERQDICGLRLYMDAHNASARKAYEKLGMRQTNYEIFELDFVLAVREKERRSDRIPDQIQS